MLVKGATSYFSVTSTSIAGYIQYVSWMKNNDGWCMFNIVPPTSYTYQQQQQQCVQHGDINTLRWDKMAANIADNIFK